MHEVRDTSPNEVNRSPDCQGPLRSPRGRSWEPHLIQSESFIQQRKLGGGGRGGADGGGEAGLGGSDACRRCLDLSTIVASSATVDTIPSGQAGEHSSTRLTTPQPVRTPAPLVGWRGRAGAPQLGMPQLGGLAAGAVDVRSTGRRTVGTARGSGCWLSPGTERVYAMWAPSGDQAGSVWLASPPPPRARTSRGRCRGRRGGGPRAPPGGALVRRPLPRRGRRRTPPRSPGPGRPARGRRHAGGACRSSCLA